MLAPLLRKKAIWRVDAPPDTISEWKEKLEQGRHKWGKYFEAQDQCDLFNMLPVSEEDKVKLMENMIKVSKLRDEIRLCEGAADTSAEHRQQCINCVTKHHPSMAKPFYQ
jgi:hypothetical protein